MSSLQDLVLDTSDDSEFSMYVMSNVIEPINKSKTSLKFVIPNEGILSRDSYLQFELKAGSTPGCFLPIGSGIFSLLANAELRIGSQRIQSNPNLSIFRQITKSYDTPSYRNNYTRYMNGIATTVSPCPVGSTSPTAGNSSAGMLQLTAGVPQPSDMTIQNLPYDLTITTNYETTPVWSIKLSDLFPIFDTVELPCFLIKNPIEILLTLHTQDNGNEDASPNSYGALGCFKDGPGAGSTVELNLDSCLLFSDHLYYSDTRMFQIEEQMNFKNGMSLLYTDVISVVNSQPKVGSVPGAGATATIKKVFPIPISNFSVKNLFTCWNTTDYTGSTQTASTGTNSNKLLGKYALLNSPKPYHIQVRINDELHYPQDLVSDALKFSECEYVYGSPANLCCGMYSYNGSNSGTGGYNFQANNSGFFSQEVGTNYNFWGSTGGAGINVARNLTGCNHFLGINVSNMYGDNNQDTIIVGQKPVELLVDWFVNEDGDVALNNITFAECVKMFSLDSGEVIITDQVRHIQAQ